MRQLVKAGRELFIVILLCGTPGAAFGIEFSGNVAVETRLFPEDALFEAQHSVGNISAALSPELYHSWENGYQSFTIAPFFRYDQHDERRTHFDIRELFWEKAWRSWELRVGIRRVFWGVTESQHLVDIINQTDLVENLDGEDKLGQPMINATFIQDWGVIDIFVLPGFRERTFPGEDSRLRFPLIVDEDRVIYESDAEELHLDGAIRWFHTIDVFDIGLAHFHGTSRDPLLIPDINENGDITALIPRYDIIDQTSLDVQATIEGWLLKFEGISRTGQGDRFYAATGGFEYTFGDVWQSGIDIGFIGEYLWDDRPAETAGLFADDIFVGSRLAFNDVQSTDILAGVIIDRETGAGLLNIEASRRFGDSWKLEVQARGFLNVDIDDPLYGYSNDSHLQLELFKYF